MANERTTRAPLTATVGERLGEKAHEGDTAGLDRAQAAVEDLRSSGWPAGGAAAPQGEPPPPEARRPAGRTPPRQGRTRAASRGSGIGWALAAGLATFAVVGMVRRAFGR
jgi:hypothetical protein